MLLKITDHYSLTNCYSLSLNLDLNASTLLWVLYSSGCDSIRDRSASICLCSLAWCSLSFSWMNSFLQCWQIMMVLWCSCLTCFSKSSWSSNFASHCMQSFFLLWKNLNISSSRRVYLNSICVINFETLLDLFIGFM